MSGDMMKSEIHGIEFVARMVAQIDVGNENSRSSMLPELVDEQSIECCVVLTQPLQETQYDTDADEPTYLIGSNETMLNVELVLENVSVGDVVADVGDDSKCGSSANYYYCFPNW
jgi:hypothetical protein